MYCQEWLIEQLLQPRNNMLFRGHYSERGNPRRQFVVVVYVDPIPRLKEDFSPFLGVVKLWEEKVGHGWRFSIEISDGATSLQEQMAQILGKWRQSVLGWDRQTVRYCSTDSHAGYSIPMENIELTIELGRIQGAVACHLQLMSHSDHERRVLQRADGALNVAISQNLLREDARHRKLS